MSFKIEDLESRKHCPDWFEATHGSIVTLSQEVAESWTGDCHSLAGCRLFLVKAPSGSRVLRSCCVRSIII